MIDHEQVIRDVIARHAGARSELASVEAERDDVFRAAHRQGGLSVRTIAAIAGMSHQRVGQIVAPPYCYGTAPEASEPQLVASGVVVRRNASPVLDRVLPTPDDGDLTVLWRGEPPFDPNLLTDGRWYEHAPSTAQERRAWEPIAGEHST